MANKLSECCDAKIIYTDICSKCMEHCGVYEEEDIVHHNGGFLLKPVSFFLHSCPKIVCFLSKTQKIDFRQFWSYENSVIMEM